MRRTPEKPQIPPVSNITPEKSGDLSGSAVLPQPAPTQGLTPAEEKILRVLHQPVILK
jgi:hypothetical protein